MEKEEKLRQLAALKAELEELKALKEQQDSVPVEQEENLSPYEKVKRGGAKALEAVGKGLDYADGVFRTAAVAPFMDKVTAQDVVNALKANPLSGDEILKRAGRDKGANLSASLPGMYSETGDEWLKFKKGGWADPSRRGFEGFALETALSPTAMLSGGLSAAAKAATKAGKPISKLHKASLYATRPAGQILEDLGTARYKTAFKDIDERLEGVSKPPISPVFVQKGMPIVTTKGIRKNALQFNREAGRMMGDIEAQSAKRGASVDMMKAMEPSMEYSTSLRASPNPDIKRAGNTLDDIALAYLESGKVPVDEARKMSTLENALGKKVFDPLTSAPFSKEGAAARGQGIKKEVYNAIEETTPELNDAYRLANSQFAVTGSEHARKEMKNLAKSAAKKNPFTLVDASLAGSIAINPKMALVLAAKKAWEFNNSTLGRTGGGKLLYNLGNYGDQLIRKPSVWEDLYKDEEKNK